MFDEYNKHDVSVYGGYLDDDIKILQSASGGIATALSESMLQQGGYVAGVAYSADFYNAEYIITHELSDIARLKGSKYIDCDKKNIYSDVKALLDSGEKVLFFGLPCVVAALYKYIGSRPENLVTCELICHGPTYPQVHREYIEFLEREHKSKIIDFSVRYKDSAWTPSYLYAKFENGTVFKKQFYHTEYGIAFTTLAKGPCYNCKFKGNNRQGDIMIGDFWGATDGDAYWNKCGISSIFAETDKGDAFLNATPGIKLFPTTFEKVVERNLMVIKSRQQKNNQEQFSSLLSKKGLIYAANYPYGVKAKVKKLASIIIPKKILPLVKKAYSSIKDK